MPIVMSVLQTQIQELNLTDRCTFCYDGLEAETAATDILTSCQNEVQPIQLMLIDF